MILRFLYSTTIKSTMTNNIFIFSFNSNFCQTTLIFFSFPKTVTLKGCCLWRHHCNCKSPIVFPISYNDRFIFSSANTDIIYFFLWETFYAQNKMIVTRSLYLRHSMFFFLYNQESLPVLRLSQYHSVIYAHFLWTKGQRTFVFSKW